MEQRNIIQRQKLKPLLDKACELAGHYEKAADCMVSVLGPDLYPVKGFKKPDSTLFCSVCKHHNCDSQEKSDPMDYPCNLMHYNAVKDSRLLGGSYIYMCDKGFVFWTSPFFSGKHLAGAMIAGRVLGVNKEQAAENMLKISGGKITRNKIKKHLEKLPSKNYEEVKALAQMMLICSEQLSLNEEEISIEPADYSYNNEDMHRERMLLVNLRRGDREEARKLLDKLMEPLYSSGCLESQKERAIELAVLISRAAVYIKKTDVQAFPTEDPPDEGSPQAILAANNRYIKKIEEAQNVNELSGILNVLIDRMAGSIFSFQGVHHFSALKKAERFIWENYTKKISLSKIAREAGLSAPYFSTIFKKEMGENLPNYLNKLRVGKAKNLLIETYMPIQKIATACGFEDQSWFTKTFKCQTGLSPGKYREQGGICRELDWLK